MGGRYVAYIRITDKNGKEFIYAMHKNKTTKGAPDQLTEDEKKRFLDTDFLWN